MARIWNPASSMRWRICPERRRLTASGLIMDNVRSCIGAIITGGSSTIGAGGRHAPLSISTPHARVKEAPVSATPSTPRSADDRRDPALHKGAIEGDRPDDEQLGNPHGDGVDDEGLPDDPVATAED